MNTDAQIASLIGAKIPMIFEVVREIEPRVGMEELWPDIDGKLAPCSNKRRTKFVLRPAGATDDKHDIMTCVEDITPDLLANMKEATDAVDRVFKRYG